MAKAKKIEDTAVRTMEIDLSLPGISTKSSSPASGSSEGASSGTGSGGMKGDVGGVSFSGGATSGGQAVLAKIDDERIIVLEKSMKTVSERIMKIEESVAGFKMDTSDIMQKLASMESNMGDIIDVREGLSTMERTMRELSSLYDLISAQFNPFIEMDNNLQKKKNL